MKLRPMTMEDADFMLSLKNDPQTRDFAIVSHDEISKEDHYKWLEDNLQYFQVIESDVRCGAVRIHNNEVSIWIDSPFRGKGIATFILNKVSENGMIAHIVEGNVASMKAFIRAGFEPINYVSQVAPINCNFYIFKR